MLNFCQVLYYVDNSFTKPSRVRQVSSIEKVSALMAAVYRFYLSTVFSLFPLLLCPDVQILEVLNMFPQLPVF